MKESWASVYMYVEKILAKYNGFLTVQSQSLKINKATLAKWKGKA
jgi:hypothetical protein